MTLVLGKDYILNIQRRVNVNCAPPHSTPNSVTGSVFHKKCTVINTKLVNILITSLIIQGKLLPKLTLAPFITALSVRIGSCVIVGANVPCNWDI